MKIKKRNILAFALIIALLLYLIALLIQVNNRLDALDEMSNKLAGVKSQYANIYEKQEYQNKLLEEIVMNQHKPVPQPAPSQPVQPKQQPKIQSEQKPVPTIDTPSVIKTLPFIPLVMEKFKHAFSF